MCVPILTILYLNELLLMGYWDIILLGVSINIFFLKKRDFHACPPPIQAPNILF